jgi:hypothetical protein
MDSLAEQVRMLLILALDMSPCSPKHFCWAHPDVQNGSLLCGFGSLLGYECGGSKVVSRVVSVMGCFEP